MKVTFTKVINVETGEVLVAPYAEASIWGFAKIHGVLYKAHRTSQGVRAYEALWWCERPFITEVQIYLESAYEDECPF